MFLHRPTVKRLGVVRLRSRMQRSESNGCLEEERGGGDGEGGKEAGEMKLDLYRAA
jgi:hypothetical protein